MKDSAKRRQSKKKITFEQIFGGQKDQKVAEMENQMAQMQELGEDLSN